MSLFSMSWVAHLSGMGSDLTVLASLLPSRCDFFVFGHRVSFLVGSSVLLSMAVHQPVVILVSSQEMSPRPSTRPSTLPS